MLKQKFVFAVSLIAMVTVGIGAARADIASTIYVQQGVNSAKTAASAAQTSANNANTAAVNAQTSANEAQEAADAAQRSADSAAASAQTANEAVATKFGKTSNVTNAIVTTDGSGNVAPVAIVDQGTGTYVTDVAVSAGKVTLTRGTPSIPTVNNATLTIQKNGVTVDTFTANASTDKTINISVPTGALADKSIVTSAEIASGTIVNDDISASAAIAQGKISGLTDALAAKELDANKIKVGAGGDLSEEQKNSTVFYPSMATTSKMISDANSGLEQTIQNLQDEDEGILAQAKGYTNTKINALDLSTVSEAGKAIVSVTQSDGSVTATAGEINSAGITDGTVALADLAANSVNSAKIVDLSIATGDIADGAVTAAKTSGVIGSIPSGSATSTTYASIWVE